MSKKYFKGERDKRDGGRFVQVPASVLDGAAYLSVSSHARMLLWDLFAQYNGRNNGDFCATFGVMKKRGWRSTHTLQNAKNELLNAGLIAETRKGCRPNKCSLYAVTWLALDDCGGKLDIKPSGFPRGAYRLKDAPPPLIRNARLNAPTAPTDSP